MKLILGGHWAQAPKNWTILTEAEQDITKPLNFPDNSVDAIFTEHVIEHISMERGIFFIKEHKKFIPLLGLILAISLHYLWNLSVDLERGWVNLIQYSIFFPAMLAIVFFFNKDYNTVKGM